MADHSDTGLVSASAPTFSAATRVFHITELLGKILEEVVRDSINETSTLLLSQRTCKAFRDTIKDSPTLRRALFFDRDPIQNPMRYNTLLLSPRTLDVEDGTMTRYHVRWLPTTEEDPCEVMVSVYRWQSGVERENIQGSWRRMHLFGGAQEPIVTAVYFSGICRKRVEGRWVNPRLSEILGLVNAEGAD